MSYFRIQWPRYLMVLVMLVMLLAVVPAQSLGAQSRTPASTTPDWTAPHVPGQLLVKFSATSPATAATLAAQTGLSVKDTIPATGDRCR